MLPSEGGIVLSAETAYLSFTRGIGKRGNGKPLNRWPPRTERHFLETTIKTKDMKSYRFEMRVKNGAQECKVYVTIPLHELQEVEGSVTPAAVDWAKAHGLDVAGAKYKGFAYTKEDIIAARHNSKTTLTR